MIRINLLGVERKATKTPITFNLSQQAPMVCLALLLGAAGGTGWWFWSLRQDSLRVDADTVAANREAARLKSLLVEVSQFEARSKQLQQRVQLIESLRAGQSVPVQLLDHISRSLPDMLWLTELNQDGGAVTLQGRSTTLIALSDFVGNLGSNALLQKPIEIVNSQVEPGEAGKNGQPTPDLISFTVRAQLAGAPPPEPTTRKRRGRA
ncbi:MAG TPA: PilN domain-containing protein [Vicinamibacterales bacterium]